MHCIFSDGRFFNKALQVAKSTKHAICHSFVTSGQVMWMLMNVVYLTAGFISLRNPTFKNLMMVMFAQDPGTLQIETLHRTATISETES